MSCGATMPPAAWPIVRISIIVRTIVRMTTSVAPNARASSRRTDESNNILRFPDWTGIMDFKTQVAGAGGLAALPTDALLVVVAGAAVPDALEAPLAAVLNDAVAAGDFAFKPGSVLYAHRVAGVKAGRVAFAAAGD